MNPTVTQGSYPGQDTLKPPAGVAWTPTEILSVLPAIRETAWVVAREGRFGVAVGPAPPPEAGEVLARLAPLYPEWLGDPGFRDAHQVRFPYVLGAMANGIHTARMTLAAARGGMIGFFGAAGLLPDRIEQALDEIQGALGPDAPGYGSNLIHSPNEPELEARAVDLYLRRGVPRIEASAFMSLSPQVVRYALRGLSTDPQGRIVRRNHVFAKISRPEVALPFMSPAPRDMVAALLAAGHLTEEEARLSAHVAVAEDITVEADSGGHTDNRPLTSLFPVIAGLRNRAVEAHRLARPVRVGAAGGLGTPSAVAAAFSLGAAYVVTGSVNQGAVESGLSPDGRALLAQAGIADVIMAPAADMFELGVKLQVLRRGTMFATRAGRLWDCYSRYQTVENLPPDEKARLEREIFQRPLEEIWEETVRFFSARDPQQLERAASDGRHRFALLCRWYLGLSSRWAIAGTPERKMDYQIWCGPAMGAFNEWVRGSFLEQVENRDVTQIACNLLEGAAWITRAHQLRLTGVPIPEAAFDFSPRVLH